MGNSSQKHSKEKPKKNVHWKSAETPSQPGKPNLVPGSLDTTPDVVTIHWEKPKYDGGSPITGYLVEHRRTGSPHWVRATPLLVAYPEISLSGLEPGWRYQFRVIAENAVGKSEPSELSDPLTVTLQRNAITAPHFTTEVHDTTAIENEKVEFKVNVVGTPTPQINWFKDGFEIFSSRRTKISTDNTISSLIIHQSALTDEGEIKCTATNRAGHVVTRAKLSIEAPPKIRLPRQYEDGLIIEADEVVRLKVGIAGRPIPNILWSHNGEVISNDSRHEIITNDKNSSLKIANSRRDDRGEYHIKATNKLGDDNASFLVTVTAKPQSPGKVSITMSLGKSVTLSWQTPDDDGGCKIGNYIVEYFRQGWNVWLKGATTRQLTTTLNDLIEGSEYKFRVKAENPYGLSEPSEESDVIFIPDPKRGLTTTTSVPSIEETLETVKPIVTPRRHTKPDISPIIHINSSTPTRPDSIKSIKSSVHFDPEILDSENIGNEMSYGTSDALYTSRSERKVLQESPQEKNMVNGSLKMQQKQNGKVIMFDKRKESERNPVNDVIHNSNEFMLVLYPEGENEEVKREKEIHHTSSLELDIEDAIAPPLSLSAPDLSVEPPPAPVMRHSVSSTELLYERAMSRFYQAVAFEESEKLKVRSTSVISREQSLPPRIRLGSFTDTIEKKNFRKSNDFPPLSEPKMQLLKVEPNLIKQFSTESERSDISGASRVSGVSEYSEDADVEYQDDYTDSTASSDESETEKFKRAVQSANIKPKTRKQHPENDEMETYHPRTMNVVSISTNRYRSPPPDQAVEVLSVPLPLPSPDFIPKPILKRTNDLTAQNKSPNKQKRKLLTTLFSRDDKDSTNEISKKTKKKTEIEDKNKENGNKTQPQKKMTTEQKKLLELRQDSIEEAKVMIDHYSDIVKELGVTRAQNKVPIYLNSEELRKVANYSDNEEENDTPKEIVEVLKTSVLPKQPPQNVESKQRLSRDYSQTSIVQERHGRDLSSNRVSNKLEIQNEKPVRDSSQTRTPITQNHIEKSRPSRNNSKTRIVENNNSTIQIPSSSRDSSKTRSSETATQRTPRNLSKTRTNQRSRSNSGIRTESNTKTIMSNTTNTNTKPRSRNPSRSPVVKNRIQLTDEPNESLKHKLKQIEFDKLNQIASVAMRESSESVQIKAEQNVKSTLNYLTDISLFVIACWLYLFKDARLVIPILMLILYRQLSNAVQESIPEWMKRKKS